MDLTKNKKSYYIILVQRTVIFYVHRYEKDYGALHLIGGLFYILSYKDIAALQL